MQYLKKITKYFFLSILLLFVEINSCESSLEETIGGTSLDGKFEGWLHTLLVAIIAIAGVVAAAVLIFNAFLYITASGDEGKVTKATKGITYAIVGLILAAIAFLIVNFVIKDILTS